MKHFLEVTVGLVAQFTGSQGGIEHGIVEFGLALIFWLGLLILAWFRQRDHNLPHEKLLLLGFFLGFCRELFMLIIAILPAYGVYSVESLHVIFPPLKLESSWFCWFTFLLPGGGDNMFSYTRNPNSDRHGVTGFFE